jgi:hypothetical protein
LFRLNAEEEDAIHKIRTAIRGRKNEELPALYAKLENIKTKGYACLTQLNHREILKVDRDINPSKIGGVLNECRATVTPMIAGYVKKTQKIEDRGNGVRAERGGISCKINGKPVVFVKRKFQKEKIADFAFISAELFKLKKEELENELKEATRIREECYRECSDDSIKELTTSNLRLVENKARLMENYENLAHLKNVFNLKMLQTRELVSGVRGDDLADIYQETLNDKNKETDIRKISDTLASNICRNEKIGDDERKNLKERITKLSDRMKRLNKYVETISREDGSFFRHRGTSTPGLYDLFNEERGKEDGILSFKDIKGGGETEDSSIFTRYANFLKLVGPEGSEKYREVLGLARRKITDELRKTQAELNSIFDRAQNYLKREFEQSERDITSVKKTRVERERQTKEAKRRGGMESARRP